MILGSTGYAGYFVPPVTPAAIYIEAFQACGTPVNIIYHSLENIYKPEGL
jgi:hypothetical protein